MPSKRMEISGVAVQYTQLLTSPAWDVLLEALMLQKSFIRPPSSLHWPSMNSKNSLISGRDVTWWKCKDSLVDGGLDEGLEDRERGVGRNENCSNSYLFSEFGKS